jgi:hypothetical protein
VSTDSIGSTWRWLRNLPWADFATTANATRFRYRDQLWPLAILGILSIARLMADGANTPGVLLLCLFISAAVVFYLRRKLDRAKEWMYAGCCLGGASLGLILISLIGTDNRTLNATSIIGGFGLALIWWCHHEVRGWHGHSTSTLVNRWNAHILESKGDLGGATLGPPTPFAHGNKHKLQLIPGRQTLPMFQANILKIESGLRTPLKDLILEKDPDTDDPTMLELTHITKSPIKNTIWFDKPRCVDGMINVGPYADGIGEAFFRIYTENSMHSGFILGGTGAGKSRALDQLAISVLSMRNTIVFYIDGQNGASSPTLWKYADWAVGTDGFFKMMAALELGARWRQRENSAKGWDGSEPSEERPGILVILDEMHRITPLAPDRIAMAVCEWRKLLMAIWGADQDSGLESTFAGKDRMRSAMLTGNSSVMHVKSRIAGNLIPGLAINPADLPKIPGYAVLVADEGVEDPNGDPVRTAPYRNRYAPSKREKDKAEAKGIKVPVRTLEEWYELYPNPKMDRGTALAMGTNYLRRHETAAAAQADLLRDIESIADIDDDTLDRALAELSPSSETKMAEASEQKSTEGDSGDSAVTGEQIMALDWAGPKTRAQILEELEGRNGVKPNTSTVTYALSKLKAAQRLDQPSRGVYAIKGSGG